MPREKRRTSPSVRTREITEEKPVAPVPHQRYMTIVAQDPAVQRKGKILMAKVAVPAEELERGPIGYRVQLVDYDSSTGKYHGAHELPGDYDAEPPEWRNGDAGLLGDYRFHAQNAYALVMKTLARFELALGRRLGWSFPSHQLKVAPHGMVDANAFYSPRDEGLVFGYFDGLTGKPVYTCLSHDIVVHETTHALLDCLRERYMYPSGPDQAAFHEGFADVVALLSVFALPEVVEHLLSTGARASARPALIPRKAVTVEALRDSALFGLAEEMGQEIEGMRGSALRQSALIEPDPNILQTPEYQEAHRRGEVFVAAVMRGFIAAWADRVAQLGLPNQRSYPLAAVVEEGADIADTLATMWIRAIDYMPPVHLEFGDALSALITADAELRPDDSRFKLRYHLLTQFAAYGIPPAASKPNPVEPGAWSPPPDGLRYDRVRFDSMRTDKDEVFRFLWDNREKLQLQKGAYTQVISVRPCTRTGRDGFVLRETVAEYYQVARLTPDELIERKVKAPPDYLRSLLGSVPGTESGATGNGEEESAAGDAAAADPVTPLYGGGVLIFDEYGRLKHWVHKDVFGGRQADRLEYLWNEGYLVPDRGEARFRPLRFSAVHLRRAVDARQSSQGW